MNKTIKKNRCKNRHKHKNKTKNKTKKGGMYKRSNTTTSGKKMEIIENALPQLGNDELDIIYKFVIQKEIYDKSEIFKNKRIEEEEDELQDIEYNKRVISENNRRLADAMAQTGQDPNNLSIGIPIHRQRRERQVRFPWWKQ